MCAHNGTHIDAPSHFIIDGKNIDEIELSKLIGYAYVAEHNGFVTLDVAKEILKRAKAQCEEAAKKIRRRAKLYMLLSRDYVPHMTYKTRLKNLRSLFVFPFSRLIGRYRANAWHEALNKKHGHGEYTVADDFNKEHLFPISLFDEYDTILFEGKPYRCVKDKETYLRLRYGEDYMQLPPPEARVMHLAHIIDTEKSYTEYIKK